MKVKWLIEQTAFIEDIERMFIQLELQGIEYKKIKYVPFFEGAYSDGFDDKNYCVVFYGSLNLARQLDGMMWTPGVLDNPEQFKCSGYYPYFGEYLLNKNYVMLPFGELQRRKEFLYNIYGKRDIFVRPDGGQKEFTGKVVQYENFDKDLELFNIYDEVTPSTLVVVAEPINLVEEWRFVVVNGRVVTGSQYKHTDWNCLIKYNKGPVFDYANEVVEKVKFNPCPVWVIDICQTENKEYFVLETGGFSSCGLYQCDTKIVIEEVSRIAEELWALKSGQLDEV